MYTVCGTSTCKYLCTCVYTCVVVAAIIIILYLTCMSLLHVDHKYSKDHQSCPGMNMCTCF